MVRIIEKISRMALKVTCQLVARIRMIVTFIKIKCILVRLLGKISFFFIKYENLLRCCFQVLRTEEINQYAVAILLIIVL